MTPKRIILRLNTPRPQTDTTTTTSAAATADASTTAADSTPAPPTTPDSSPDSSPPQHHSHSPRCPPAPPPSPSARPPSPSPQAAWVHRHWKRMLLAAAADDVFAASAGWGSAPLDVERELMAEMMEDASPPQRVGEARYSVLGRALTTLYNDIARERGEDYVRRCVPRWRRARPWVLQGWGIELLHVDPVAARAEQERRRQVREGSAAGDGEEEEDDEEDENDG